MFPTREDLLKALLVVFLAAAWWFVYSSLNAFNAQPQRAVYLKARPADYWPWIIQPASAIVYVGLAAVLLIWPLALSWRGRAFWEFVAMVVIGTAIGFAIFAIWPLNIRRPEFAGQRIGEALMRTVFAIDRSANCFPSFHTFFAVLGAIVVVRQSESLALSIVASVMALGVVISTVTTGQHYAIDVLGGGGLAVFSYSVVRYWEFLRASP